MVFRWNELANLTLVDVFAFESVYIFFLFQKLYHKYQVIWLNFMYIFTSRTVFLTQENSCVLFISVIPMSGENIKIYIYYLHNALTEKCISVFHCFCFIIHELYCHGIKTTTSFYCELHVKQMILCYFNFEEKCKRAENIFYYQYCQIKYKVDFLTGMAFVSGTQWN